MALTMVWGKVSFGLNAITKPYGRKRKRTNPKFLIT